MESKEKLNYLRQNQNIHSPPPEQEAVADPNVKRKQMEDKGLALMSMLNKKAVIDDEDPENRKIDQNIAEKMEV